MIDDETIRVLVSRLSRLQPGGGRVIERAAILAEGADSPLILAWIADHDGHPEAPVATAARGGGLHGGRMGGSGAAQASAPRRYVLPPGVLP